MVKLITTEIATQFLTFPWYNFLWSFRRPPLLLLTLHFPASSIKLQSPQFGHHFIICFILGDCRITEPSTRFWWPVAVRWKFLTHQNDVISSDHLWSWLLMILQHEPAWTSICGKITYRSSLLVTCSSENLKYIYKRRLSTSWICRF